MVGGINHTSNYLGMEEASKRQLVQTVLSGILILIISFSAASLTALLTHAFQTEEISNWEPVVTEDYTVDWRASHSKIIAVFSYEYGGERYEAESFSPFEELNEAAGEDRELVQRMLSKDHPPITVYVNPENPEMASIASGWSRSGYSNDLNGVVLLTLSFIGLYFCLRPGRRVRDLIPG